MNKIREENERTFAKEQLPSEELLFAPHLSELQQRPHEVSPDLKETLEKIYEKAQDHNRNDRLERTYKKFERNKEFAHTH